MRQLRILFLHLQNILEYRSLSFVWFIVTLANPMIYLLFWWGSYIASGGHGIGGLSLSSVASYYFLMVIAAAFLQSHIEENVAYDDIQLGALSMYLTKPFSYFWLKFYHEMPWRIIQGLFGVVVFFLVRLLVGNIVTFSYTPLAIASGIFISIAAYFISFIFKMILGLSAFWTTDFFGLQQLSDAIVLIFSGMVVPIIYFPQVFKIIANVLPFSYTIYYPVVAFQGALQMNDIWRIVAVQCIWLMVLIMLYRWIWHRGIIKYTGIGQ